MRYNLDKEKTELWRISFAEANIYNIKKWNLLKGGRIYYNQDAAIMAETVNWNYDYREVLSNNKKATIIQGDFDFLDFNAETHKMVLSQYPNIKLQIIKNAGHNIWIDEPVKFRIALQTALENKGTNASR